MTIADWVGSVGVTILLIAFLLNSLGKIHRDGFLYVLMNLVGAIIACLASILLHYMPFIVLEAAWILVSVVALINLVRKRTI